ncbi:MAG: ATP-binding protein, partial [Patescibacteria group bacterium]|nr:ATP-binding protein [Patescibacteria group bacterium]
MQNKIIRPARVAVATPVKDEDPFVDNFFMPAANNKPYFKMALQGFAGTGKTYTAALIAIGLHQRTKSAKPVIIFDTEKSAKFLKPLFDNAGIPLLVKESRSLADLVQTMQRCEKGASDILLIDSLSHV